MSENRLTGAIDLTQLPSSLEELSLWQNQLTGPVDLTQLPATLTHLRLAENQLTGAVDLTRLPASLMTLWLQRNAGLTGVWCGKEPPGFDLNRTSITVAYA